MNEHPWYHRTALRKWEWLLAKGYVEIYTLDQDNLSDGIEFHHPDKVGKGFIDWWGRVTWKEE